MIHSAIENNMFSCSCLLAILNDYRIMFVLLVTIIHFSLTLKDSRTVRVIVKERSTMTVTARNKKRNKKRRRRRRRKLK